MSWEITGNHYLALPAIGPADGAIHSVNVLHRGMASLIGWAAAMEPVPGGPALLGLGFEVDGAECALEGVRIERLDRWIPRFGGRAGGVEVTVTVFAPGGFDPLVPGGAIAVHLKNGGPEDRRVRVRLDGRWVWAHRSTASTRSLRGENRLCGGPGPTVVLEAGEPPVGAALAVRCEGGARLEAGAGEGPLADRGEAFELCAPNGSALRFRLSAERLVRAGRRTAVSFVIAVAPERDGARAVAGRLAGTGADELLRRARLDLASLNRASEDGSAREILARNLVFHHYWAAARAIDDDRLYPIQSRSPEHGACAVFDERRALGWSLPAYALTDPLLARELLLRCLEIYSDRPGNLARYVDGGVLDGAFSLGRLCDWGMAIDRYIEITNDKGFAGEPLVQQVLRELDDGAWSRLHPEVFLGRTEVLSGSEPADHPFCAFDNALLWRLCRAVERWWPGDGERPRLREGADEVAAAFWQRFGTDVDGLPVIAYTTDLDGRAAVYDDPAGSLGLLPWLGFCEPDDPIWVNTMELLRSPAYPLWLGSRPKPGLANRSRPGEAVFAALCAELLTSRRDDGLAVLRSLDLPGGVAAVGYDPDTGRAVSGPYAASEAGFLVWALLEGKRAAGREAGARR